MTRKRSYFAIDLERQDEEIAARRMGNIGSSVPNFGRFNCPKCGVILFLGNKMHACDPWILLGKMLDAYQRELMYQRKRRGHAARYIWPINGCLEHDIQIQQRARVYPPNVVFISLAERKDIDRVVKNALEHKTEIQQSLTSLLKEKTNA